MRRSSCVGLAIFGLVLAASGNLGPPRDAAAFVGVTGDLRRALQAQAPGTLLRVNIILSEQHDLGAVMRATAGITDRRQRRAEIWERVQLHALASQAPVWAVIEELEAARLARDAHRLIAANGINVWLGRAAIEEVAALPEVRSIDWDEARPVAELIDLDPATGEPQSASQAMQWHISRVRAPQMWGLGYDGDGVLIGVIDTGVNYDHWDLRDHMWDGAPEFPHHGWNFAGNNDDPMDLGDASGHGTRSAGICCGDGTAGTHTGVAPRAIIMALKAAGATGTESMIWDAEDFAIAHGCDVITASLSWKYNANPDYATWRQQEDLLLAADIPHSQSAGNQGSSSCCPIPYNVSAPGLCPPPWLHPDQTLLGGLSGVTAVGNVDADDVIDPGSSHGPSSWQEVPEYGDYPWDPGMGLLRPDLAAPGTGTLSTAWNVVNGYALFGGTSAAAPHVGGAYCLLRQAHPELGSADLARYLQLGAVELGEPGKDNFYGAGRLDVLGAHMLITPLALSPPTDLVATDTPFDHGGSIDLGWTLSADDGAGNGLVEEYAVFRTTVPGSYFPTPLAEVVAGSAAFQDTTTVDGVEYYYRLEAWGNGLESEPSNEAGPVVSAPNLPAAIDDREAGAGLGHRRRLAVSANPFSAATRIEFELQVPQTIAAVVYDVRGARIRTLREGVTAAGRQLLVWDGRDDAGRAAPSGIYLLRLRGSRFGTTEQKLLKLR